MKRSISPQVTNLPLPFVHGAGEVSAHRVSWFTAKRRGVAQLSTLPKRLCVLLTAVAE
ncbi:hypothetical protein [Vibrio coralliilyticus]|uniref:hypothetical protein n=1 Tax=Vibrio coralliilyticus TaxID=190893 RepID=UPI00148E10C7|nr:hypothetical protein [Vibrio coralliilyticus]